MNGILRSLALIALAAALASCGGTVVVLRNPETGQTAQCKGFNWGQTTPSRDTDICVEYYEKMGFRPIELKQ
ncbi:MAG TPA: hypothetical protein VN832_07220 [Stellaceae bacterium]|nr:hypothetical protein [Stellaceae bacterium]